MRWTYEQSDPALMLWTAAVQRFGLTWPCVNPRVLELGCSETDWLERMARQNPEASFTGLDIRHDRDANGWVPVVGDASNPWHFPAESFDVVVLLGAVEHFGLGFYGDPACEDGDIRTMQNVLRWLAPSGWVYFDVPCNPEYGVAANRHFRTYSPGSVAARLLPAGLTERARGYSEPEPTAGTWVDAPTAHRSPYWYVAVQATKD